MKREYYVRRCYYSDLVKKNNHREVKFFITKNNKNSSFKVFNYS